MTTGSTNFNNNCNKTKNPFPIKSTTHSSSSNKPTAISVGLQADNVYQSQMFPWQFTIRSILLATLNKEIKILEAIQRVCRSRILDRLMIHSSWLGSHQFFILSLPLIFWIGDHRLARSQVYILAMSVYLTGTLKDFFCIPRPYSPPIIRLSISNHAAEYGFPSTHSATSSAIALVGLEYALSVESTVCRVGLLICVGLYASILVFGRVYCGMHSIQDVVCGCGIGALSWTIYRVFGAGLEGWVTSSGISVPIILVVSGLLITAGHPQPIEDCPCFEDSTAFVAVSVGVMTGHWIGHAFIEAQAANLHRSGLWSAQAIVKLLLGLTVLFSWRFAMKELLSHLLPPVFRICAPLLELPRRHYAPTKDYSQYRNELREHQRHTGLRARLVPSVVNLPRLLQTQPSPTETCQSASTLHPALRNCNPSAVDPTPLPVPSILKAPSPTALSKRYDVDVLMRLIVYAGIGFLSSHSLPLLFNTIGLDG